MVNKTIWITGAFGRLGTELTHVLAEHHDCKIIGTDTDVDITDLEAVNQAIDMYRPIAVINCASISDVEYCENNMVEAFKVNALGARNLAIATRRVNAKLIHLSTDDIFDGKKTGFFTEFDNPEPINVYGKSKLAGEQYVRELNPKHLIIRSSWVYGTAKGDYYTFVKNNGKNRTSFEAPVDNISSPTSARELAAFIAVILDKTEYGVYHASSEGSCSRYEFAKAILEELNYDTTLVVPVESKDSAGQKSTLLENLMMKMTELYEMPQWQKCLEEYIKNEDK